MEKKCAFLAGRDDVWYATNIEIYDYTVAFRSLEYSADAKIVYNPSGIDVWLMHKGKIYMVSSKETVVFDN